MDAPQPRINTNTVNYRNFAYADHGNRIMSLLYHQYCIKLVYSMAAWMTTDYENLLWGNIGRHSLVSTIFTHPFTFILCCEGNGYIKCIDFSTSPWRKPRPHNQIAIKQLYFGAEKRHMNVSFQNLTKDTSIRYSTLFKIEPCHPTM
jgi:hypothetical protein